MILLRLFYEFFKTGLFSVGGGMATIPFLQHMGETTGWFTNQDLTTMIAVSESTPGPLGVNMATYVGYQTAGVPGALVATLGVITPGAILILIIAGFFAEVSEQPERGGGVCRAASRLHCADRGSGPECGVFSFYGIRRPLTEQLSGHSVDSGGADAGDVRSNEVDAPEKTSPYRLYCGRSGSRHFTSALNEKSVLFPWREEGTFLFRLFIGGQGLIVQIRQGPGLIG